MAFFHTRPAEYDDTVFISDAEREKRVRSLEQRRETLTADIAYQLSLYAKETGKFCLRPPKKRRRRL